MDTIPVTLIVKAPNQQFEDQTIKCELSWTIKRLKGYLSEVYPCKPSTEEQKLIYSGQLLHDTVVLKDILRQYEGQETHTVHLVFTPKMNPRDSASGSAEGTKKTSNHDIRTAMDSEGLR
ncbi:homocysteine-responsive endoplasmic reticulum-resident ubiquitin-like domain member 2 protein [Phlebotomus papatasi]|uniref:homocysteine-responsive endoplasmic reticulum-resident ubiquitin-like domain member 2 protein n=1 Tax=Phlebotomus papatasi TaxID=29031 RepID=UPI0024843684|nr:homocysteine-responsive endoplasmic reticulum-resident ubiquitin-like domain member 2 protein [Phlebotomus papatasi]